jgi:hypothetical protein
MRSALLLIVSCFVALSSLELAIRIFDLFSASRAAIAAARSHADAPPDAPASDKLLHPFRGWSMRKRSKPLQPLPFEGGGRRNQLGFNSEIDDYRIFTESDFIVGIFGGSVAVGIAKRGSDEITNQLVHSRPDLAGKVRILNLATGSYKQPQQLMTLSEMVVLGIPFDYVVNVDGLNEVALGVKDAKAGHHPLFPAQAQMQALVDAARGAPTGAFYEASAEIIRHRRSAQRISSHASGWPFRSQLVQALAGALASRHQRKADELEAGLQGLLARGADAGLTASLPDPCLGGDSGCLDLIADIWERASRLMAAEASSIGAGYLHVLQPSQYVPGSKALTESERREAFLPGSGWMTSVQAGYPLLQARAPTLTAQGIDFLDLTPIFAEVTDTIYVDACCHPNPAGYDMLGERIGERIAERLREARR